MTSNFFRFCLQKYMIVEKRLLYRKDKPCKLARSTENYINYFDVEEVHWDNYLLKRSLSLIPQNVLGAVLWLWTCAFSSESTTTTQHLIFNQSTRFEFLIEPYAQQLPKGLLVPSRHHTSFVLYTSDRTSAVIQYHWSVSKWMTQSRLSPQGHAHHCGATFYFIEHHKSTGFRRIFFIHMTWL